MPTVTKPKHPPPKKPPTRKLPERGQRSAQTGKQMNEMTLSMLSKGRKL